MSACRLRWLGWLVNGILILGSAVITGAITYVGEHVPAVVLNDDIMNGYFDDIYIKPWCRIGPYCVGLLLGDLILLHGRSFKVNRVSEGPISDRGRKLENLKSSSSEYESGTLDRLHCYTAFHYFLSLQIHSLRICSIRSSFFRGYYAPFLGLCLVLDDILDGDWKCSDIRQVLLLETFSFPVANDLFTFLTPMVHLFSFYFLESTLFERIHNIWGEIEPVVQTSC